MPAFSAPQPPSGLPFYRIPHAQAHPPLASGIYWRATCDCHLGTVIGLNLLAMRGAK